MRETKRRLELYSFYDRTGLERHLERMAEKGWLLEKIGQFLWTYRRIEPKHLTFSVCYFPAASAFDPGPSEEQQTFYDFCAHAGWILAASNAQRQVFYNERERPVPIETDPVEEVDTIHRTMKRSFLPSQLVLLGLGVLNAALLVLRFMDDPILVLAQSSSLFSSMCWALVFIMVAVELAGYFRWHARAVRAAERGERCETRSRRKLQIAGLIFLAVCLVYFLASTLLSGNRFMITLTLLLLLLYVPGAFLAVNGIKRFMKGMAAPAGVNRAVTLVGSFVLLCAVLGIITAGTIFALDRGWLDGEQTTYEYQGRTYTLRRDPVPLALDDLLEGDFSRYERRRMEEQSLLLGQCTVHQWPIGPWELFPERVYLNYEVVLVKVPFLYDLCREAKLHERDDWDTGDPEYMWYGYAFAPADPAPWGAEEAYRWTDGSDARGERENQFLLFYPDRIVNISMQWDQPPTPAQMAVVAEKLGGV